MTNSIIKKISPCLLFILALCSGNIPVWSAEALEPLEKLHQYFNDACLETRKEDSVKAADQVLKTSELLEGLKSQSKGRFRKLFRNSLIEINRLEKKFREGHLVHGIRSIENDFYSAEIAIRAFVQKNNRGIRLPKKSLLGNEGKEGRCPVN